MHYEIYLNLYFPKPFFNYFPGISIKISWLSCLSMFCKKIAFKAFSQLTGKHICWNLCFNKVPSWKLKLCKFIKKESVEQVFSRQFCERLKIKVKTLIWWRLPTKILSKSLVNFILYLDYQSFGLGLYQQPPYKRCHWDKLSTFNIFLE